jgi:poly(3-hydroxybutyrate) depolymerase
VRDLHAEPADCDGREGWVNQAECAAAGENAPALSIDSTGLLYTPPACASGAACKLVVALHGCLSGRYLLGDEFPELANLDT